MLHGIDVVGGSWSGAGGATEPADGGTLLGGWACDLTTQALTWTDGVFDMFGFDRRARPDRRETLGFYAEQSREELERRRSVAIRTCSPFSIVASLKRADGADRWMRIDAIPQVRDGRTVGLSGIKRDVTAERAAWENLRRLAHNDPLTGVSNRAAFQAGFLDRPRGSASLGDFGALVLFDIDDFKALNDGWGHPAGDACLTTFAQRLIGLFGDARMIARIGGDEFAVLLDRDDALRHLSAGLPHIMAKLLAPFGWREGMLRFRASAGVAFGDATGMIDPDALYARADADLYRAKANRTGHRDRRLTAF